MWGGAECGGVECVLLDYDIWESSVSANSAKGGCGGWALGAGLDLGSKVVILSEGRLLGIMHGMGVQV
jgi:hypothetical protein